MLNKRRLDSCHIQGGVNVLADIFFLKELLQLFLGGRSPSRGDLLYTIKDQFTFLGAAIFFLSVTSHATCDRWTRGVASQCVYLHRSNTELHAYSEGDRAQTLWSQSRCFQFRGRLVGAAYCQGKIWCSCCSIVACRCYAMMLAETYSWQYFQLPYEYLTPLQAAVGVVQKVHLTWNIFCCASLWGWLLYDSYLLIEERKMQSHYEKKSSWLVHTVQRKKIMH